MIIALDGPAGTGKSTIASILADKLNINVIDAGHFETENPVIYRVARYLRSNFEDVEVITSLRTKSYIKYE